MPQRGRPQWLEDESRRAFAEAIAPRYLFRDEVPDIGIDGGVEEFDEDDHGTGLRYLVQIKATDDPDEALRASLDVDRAVYYGLQTLPVLLVRYVSEGKKLFARWFHGHEFKQPLSANEAKTTTFHWREQDALSEGVPKRLADEARNYLALRSAAAPLPFPFDLAVDGEPFGLTEAEIAIALRQELKPRRDVVDLRAIAPDGTGRIRIVDETLIIDLPGMEAATYTLGPEYDVGSGGAQLAIDALTLAGLAFARWDQADAAGRLALTYFARSTLAGDMTAALQLAGAMARARQVRESFELAEEIDSHLPGAEASLPFTLAALHHRQSLSAAEVGDYRRMMEQRISRREQADDRLEASRECLNLANHLRPDEPAQAIPLFERAAELDPDYRLREHYWREYAGALFLAGRTADAVAAYGQAIEIDEQPSTVLLYADALLFAGQFDEAREQFTKGAENELPLMLAGEHLLKVILIDVLREQVDVENQERDPHGALSVGEIADGASPGEAREHCLAMLRHDGLCAPAWWNLAHATRVAGDERAAATYFLCAALCYWDDVEAWGLATLLTFNSGDMELVPLILGTGQKLTDGQLMPHLAHVMAADGGDPSRRQLTLSTFQNIIDELSSELNEGAYAVRGVGPGGEVEVTPMAGASGTEPPKAAPKPDET
jgi:tetratricopeptide (TPR) repeat protein